MAFLNFMKKRGEFLGDIDLDMPPKPPKMMGEDIPEEEPIDEELMPPGRIKRRKLEPKKEELPELPPLPEEDEFLEEMPKLEDELPTLPEGISEEELPPPPDIKMEKRGFFSFLKPRKVTKELDLPGIEEEIPEMPPLPSIEEEFPEIPQLDEEEEKPDLREEKPVSIEPLKPQVINPVPERLVKPTEKPIKRFITINDFKQIQSSISDVRLTLKEINYMFGELEESKNNGDKEYDGLYNDLKDIRTKIVFMDRILFKEV